MIENIVKRLSELQSRVARLETHGTTPPSTDGTLAGDSDTVVPTEQAVKEYVDGMMKATALYQSLPALRALYPMSCNNYSGAARDISGAGLYCDPTGAPLYGYDGLAPYVELDGTDDALYHADSANLDITGTDASTVAAQRGLTLGCWFKTDTVAAGEAVLLSKFTWSTGDQRSYFLARNSASLRLMINTSGAGADDVALASSNSIGTTEWQLAIGRFDPSSLMSVFLDNTKTDLATGVPASIFNSTAEFNIGSYYNHGGGWFNGKISMAFICAAALSDSIIEAIWQQTRAMYGR